MLPRMKRHRLWRDGGGADSTADAVMLDGYTYSLLKLLHKAGRDFLRGERPRQDRR